MTLPKFFKATPGSRHSPDWRNHPNPGSLTILEKPTTGGQAVVCKVKVNASRETRALKVYKSNRETSGAREQLENELRANFPDQHFVNPIAACQISTIRDAILLPWIDGDTLKSYVSGSPDKPQRSHLMREIADAVAYLHHDVLWLHNDLKPSNIMVVDSGQSVDIRIIDFALGCPISEVTNSFRGRSDLQGVEEWVAPELHRYKDGGIQNASVQSDVWALGCVLLYILTEKTLWEYIGMGVEEDANRFLDLCETSFEDSEPIADFQSLNCPVQLRDTISRCLNVDSEQRPTARDVASVLRP